MKRLPVLIPFLAVVSAIFIGILIWAYVETRKANPQMLDERGHVVSELAPVTNRHAGYNPAARA